MSGKEKRSKGETTDSSPQLALNVKSQGTAGTEVDDRLKIHKIIRIAVSGDVLLTNLEVAIMDTPEFQRLRRVRELGTVLLVYPTALHTRFDHSLGTLSVADRMIKAIKSNTHNEPDEKNITAEEEILARLYALLHDITHIPYGHTLEDELGLFPRHDKNNKRIDRFIGPGSKVGGAISESIGEKMYERLLRIFKWDGKDPSIGNDAFIYDLVSNTVCADLIDYLKRDSYFCNLAVSFEERFLNFLYLQEENGLRRVFVRLWKKHKPTPRRDTLSDLAALLQARYVIAERAYFHHAKMISGAMLGRALQEAQISKLLSEEDMYQHTDDTLLIWLSKCQASVAQRLGQGLLDRILHKMIHTYTDRDFVGVQDHDYEHNAVDDAVARIATPEARRALEDRIAGEINASPGDVLIYAPPRDMNMKAAKMKVLWKGEPMALEDIDDPITQPRLKQILDAHRLLWGIHIIGSPHLTDKQRVIVRKACDIEFTVTADEQSERRIEYYRELIERHLGEREGGEVQATVKGYIQLRSQAAEELALSASDRRPWPARIDAVMKKYFPDQRSSPPQSSGKS